MDDTLSNISSHHVRSAVTQDAAYRFHRAGVEVCTHTVTAADIDFAGVISKYGDQLVSENDSNLPVPRDGRDADSVMVANKEIN